MKKISTTALAKSRNIDTKELFVQLDKLKFIVMKGDERELTSEGEDKGGEYIESKRFGRYIVWPEDIELDIADMDVKKDSKKILFTAKTLGGKLDMSANKINLILSELGWLKKGLKGWLMTDQGLKHGGIQAEARTSGIPYAQWPSTLLDKKSFKDSIDQVNGKSSQEEPIEPKGNSPAGDVGFRDKFKAEHRSTDGHFVRSKAEMLVDNWLYMAEIVHAYERKLPIEENVYSDFYIPTGKVYIEYWGYENNPKYLARKKEKIEIYKKYNFNLIELQDSDVQNLDDILPRLLLKYGVQAY